MAETMNYGWLQDYQEVKFAPKTLLPYIFNIDGTPIEQSLELQNLKVINQITGTADNSINANQLSDITVEGNTRIWVPISEGSNIKPVYFENGIPKEIGYTIEKNVPADAKFTDTTYSAVSNANDGLMTVNDKKKLDTIETGTWTPKLNGTDNTFSFSSATYMKINDLIVINFMINAGTSNPDFEGKPIGIETSSLPYQPDLSEKDDLWYAGGGHLQYAYRPNLYAHFTGWALAKDYIYARANSYYDGEPNDNISEDWIAGPAYMNWPPYDPSEKKTFQAGGTIMYKTTGVKNL